jgi:hypothetical protein
MRRSDRHGGGRWLLDSGRAPYAQQLCREGRKKIAIQDVHENTIIPVTLSSIVWHQTSTM